MIEECAESGAGQERLLGFYDRVRRQVVELAEKRVSVLDRGKIEALLSAPDLFILLVRLSLDRNVPLASRRWIAGALTYFLLPFDLMPEAVLGPAGFLDDVVLAAAVVNHAMSMELEVFVDRYWSGSRRAREVLSDLSTSAHSLLGSSILGRLRRVLGDRGIAI